MRLRRRKGLARAWAEFPGRHAVSDNIMRLVRTMGLPAWPPREAHGRGAAARISRRGRSPSGAAPPVAGAHPTEARIATGSDAVDRQAVASRMTAGGACELSRGGAVQYRDATRPGAVPQGAH
jgi:hypothetical protein